MHAFREFPTNIPILHSTVPPNYNTSNTTNTQPTSPPVLVSRGRVTGVFFTSSVPLRVDLAFIATTDVTAAGCPGPGGSSGGSGDNHLAAGQAVTENPSPLHSCGEAQVGRCSRDGRTEGATCCRQGRHLRRRRCPRSRAERWEAEGRWEAERREAEESGRLRGEWEAEGRWEAEARKRRMRTEERREGG